MIQNSHIYCLFR